MKKEFEKRPLIEEEDKYTFKQSAQLSAQTGLIGYLRADMDRDGNGFFSSWNGWNDRLKTQEFKDEFDEVINSLREEGDILHNRKSLANYCYSTPQAKMPTEDDYYGVRVDSEKYVYLFRLNPNAGTYNVYCYCYVQSWLDQHMRCARKGIRFITPNYEEKFHIPDGEKIRIYRLDDGSVSDEVCRYIDDYHVEIGSNLYHICEFAERMEAAECKIEPIRSDLPEQCYAVCASTGKIIIVKRNEPGYYKTDIESKDADEARQIVDECNAKRGITRAQEQAMVCGAMFGWDVPGADPENYDKDGKPVTKKG